jgi:uncharacterized repeat protein (TIGR04138 family)
MLEKHQVELAVYENIIVPGRDYRYKIEAYSFVLSSIDFCRVTLGKENHVEGDELADAVAEFAVVNFGPMASTVLHKWGIFSPIDVGNIVYNMIDINMLVKTDGDTVDDFKGAKNFYPLLKGDKLFKIDKKKIKKFQDT